MFKKGDTVSPVAEINADGYRYLPKDSLRIYKVNQYGEVGFLGIPVWWPADLFTLVKVDEMPVVAGPGRKVGDSLFSEDATFTPDETTGGVKGAKACRYDLVPVRPLAEVAAVLGQGAAKYSENNWRKGYDWGKSYAAAQRHMNRFWAGEKVDPDSGLHPLAHAIANLMFLIEFTESHPELDDRGDAPV